MSIFLLQFSEAEGRSFRSDLQTLGWGFLQLLQGMISGMVKAMLPFHKLQTGFFEILVWRLVEAWSSFRIFHKLAFANCILMMLLTCFFVLSISCKRVVQIRGMIFIFLRKPRILYWQCYVFPSRGRAYPVVFLCYQATTDYV